MRTVLWAASVLTIIVTASAATADISGDLVTSFRGDSVRLWRSQIVDDLPCRISPGITADGDELNHHRITIVYTGSGVVKLSLAHSPDERWDRAIAKSHLHSRFQKVASGKSIRIASPYKGERFAWLILNITGDVAITSIRHECFRGKGTLYGHIPLTFDFAGAKLPYRLLLPPNYDPKRKYPLVISVAGSGSVGVKNRRNMEMVILARHLFTQYYGDDDLACFSLVPQIPPRESIPAPYHPAGLRGAPDNWHPDYPAVNADGWFTQATIALIRALLADRRLSIDADRVYFTGFSYGGKACWEFLKAAPDLFTAAAAGGGWPIGRAFSDPQGPMLQQLIKEVRTYSHIPVLIFAGSKDPMRLGSKAVHEQILGAGGVSKYVELPGAVHVQSAAQAWGNRNNIRWLFSHRRPTPTTGTAGDERESTDR